MSAPLHPPRRIRWLRRQRRLAWQSILVCTLLRIGGAAMASDPVPAGAAPDPARAEQSCKPHGEPLQSFSPGNLQ